MNQEWVVEDMSVNQKRSLPVGWEWTSLGNVAKPERKRVNPQDHPDLLFIGMDDVESETMRLLSTKQSSDLKSSAEHFFPDEVLYGSLRPYLNKVYRPNFEGLCSAEFIVFRESPVLDNKYLQYFLNQWSFVTFINRQNTGDRPRIKFNQMASYPFPLAPLPEQNRIVAEIEKQFTRLDQAVASLKRAQANLARYKASVLKAACEGRLVTQDSDDEPAEKLLARILAERRARWEKEEWQKLVEKAQKKAAQARRTAQNRPARLSDLQDAEWQYLPQEEYARYLPTNDNWKKKYVEPVEVETAELPPLPKGWVWASLDQVASVSSGMAFKKSEYADKGIRLFQIANVSFGKVIWETINYMPEKYLKIYPELELRSGDVLMALNRPILNGRIKIGILTDADAPAILYQRVGKFDLYQKFMSSYFFYYAQSPRFISLLGNSLQEVDQPFVNKPTLLNTTIPLPPTPEQNRIVAELERRLSIIASNEKAIATNLAHA